MSLPETGPDTGPGKRPRPEQQGRRLVRATGAVLLAGLVAAACTVRPLYTDPSGTAGAGLAAGTAAQLSSIAISQPVTRTGQEVRNHLIFLFGRGGGQPATPVYEMDLTVLASVLTPAVVQVGTTAQEPTASEVQMRAVYTVTESATGRTVAQGSRTVSSAFDLPRQQFAAIRAQRDAEDRAARELAEQVHLSVAQEMARAQRP